MKKIMILLPIAAMALASCSNDEALEKISAAQDNQLQIVPAVQKQTRGTLTTTANLEFHLEATGAFKEGTEYESATPKTSLSENLSYTNAWVLSAKTWWADATTTATFKAYAPTTLTTSGFSPADAIADQKDVVVAYNEGVRGDFTSGVPLTFRHVLSQVIVQAVNKTPSDVTISVKAVKLVNINSKNDLTLPTASTAADFSWSTYTPWASAPTTPKSYRADQTIELIGTAKDIVGSPMLLLPQQLANVELTDGGANYASGNCIAVLIKVTGAADAKIYPTTYAVTTASSEGYAWAYVPVNTKWEPGKKYIYTLNYAKDAYGLVGPSADQTADGTPDPTKESAEDTPQEPGEPVVEGDPVELTFNVTVADWEEVTENKNL